MGVQKQRERENFDDCYFTSSVRKRGSSLCLCPWIELLHPWKFSRHHRKAKVFIFGRQNFHVRKSTATSHTNNMHKTYWRGRFWQRRNVGVALTPFGGGRGSKLWSGRVVMGGNFLRQNKGGATKTGPKGKSRDFGQSICPGMGW